MTRDAEALVKRVRSVSDLPVAVGFGISSPEQVRAVWRFADAAVVGSAIVKQIEKARGFTRSREAHRRVRAILVPRCNHLFLRNARMPDRASANTAGAITPRCSLVHNCGLQLRARASNAPCAPWSPGTGCHRLSGRFGSSVSSYCCESYSSAGEIMIEQTWASLFTS